MTVPKLVAASVVLACLAACGNPAATPPPTPSPEAVATAAFTTVIPVGWSDATRTPHALDGVALSGSVDLFMVALPVKPMAGVNDVESSVVVTTVADGPIPTADVGAYLENVADAGATGISKPQALTINGAAALEITFSHPISGTLGRARDIVVTHGATTYELIGDSSLVGYADVDAALTTVLSNWRWTDTPKLTPSASLG